MWASEMGRDSPVSLQVLTISFLSHEHVQDLTFDSSPSKMAQAIRLVWSVSKGSPNSSKLQGAQLVVLRQAGELGELRLHLEQKEDSHIRCVLCCAVLLLLGPKDRRPET